MSVSETISVSTPNGEAAIISFTAANIKQENNVITLCDNTNKAVVTITLAQDSTHRVLHTS